MNFSVINFQRKFFFFIFSLSCPYVIIKFWIKQQTMLIMMNSVSFNLISIFCFFSAFCYHHQVNNEYSFSIFFALFSLWNFSLSLSLVVFSATTTRFHYNEILRLRWKRKYSEIVYVKQENWRSKKFQKSTQMKK